LVVQAKALKTSRTIIGEEHIGFFEKAMHYFQSCFGSKIKRQAAFPSVVQLKRRIDVVTV
jgi:hypothetical protein